MSTVDTLEPVIDQPAVHPGPVRRRRSRWIGFAQRWGTFVGFVVVWQLATALAKAPYFPTPFSIAQAMQKLWLSGPASHLFLTPSVATDIVPSISRVLGGWAVSCVAGILVGIAIGLSPLLTDYTGTVFAFIRALPPVMMIPVFMVLFHIGTPMQLATIISGAIWPVLLNAVDGARSVEPTNLDVARVFKISRLRRVFTVVLPAALPRIFGGMRIAMGISLILMVIGEMTGGFDGLGYSVLNFQEAFDNIDMWAGIVLIGAFGYLLNRILEFAEAKVLSWHHESKRLVEG
jgi:ABC-type nitrate/sulfonate/bicarbonate transport system permease component